MENGKAKNRGKAVNQTIGKPHRRLGSAKQALVLAGNWKLEPVVVLGLETRRVAWRGVVRRAPVHRTFSFCRSA